MKGRVGVAISTTGTRPEMLAAARDAWIAAGLLPMIVNYDAKDPAHRDGVAVTKNRGIEGLMNLGVKHLFLADDDVHPLSRESWERYIDQPVPHLSLSWGRRRLLTRQDGYSTFTHPRGVLLYLHRSVVEHVGGMRTELGKGGDEHVEYSRRIHHAGFTPAPYMDLDHHPSQWFHAEDWARPGETPMQLAARRRRITTVKRTAADRKHMARLMAELDGDTSFVPYDGSTQ